MLAEADALEAPVLAERRAREAASRPLVASADIQVPAWDDLDQRLAGALPGERWRRQDALGRLTPIEYETIPHTPAAQAA